MFRHATYFLYAENNAGICGVLPLAHVNSRLFGNALVALPFAVYGGIAAIDADQPCIPGISAKTRFRHYVNIHRMEARLNRLLGDFQWGRMDHLFLSDT